VAQDFQFDVFLSHCSKDKPVVRKLAARLKADGVKVWLDAEQIKPGDSIPAKVDDGLEHSRLLVLCMSANAFASDWATMESGAYRFSDPLNKARCLIPLRLDNARVPKSLAQFLYIDWRGPDREPAYAQLLQSCREAKAAKARGRKTAKGDSAADSPPPQPDAGRFSGYSEAELKSTIVSLLIEPSREQFIADPGMPAGANIYNGQLVQFADIDERYGLPPGTTKRLLPKLGARHGLKAVQGTNHFIKFKATPEFARQYLPIG
jgi:hypothetical protein